MIGGGLHDGDHWSSHGIGYVDCHNHVDGVRMVLTLVNCTIVVILVVMGAVKMEVMVVVTKLVMIVVMEVVMNPDGGLRSW